MRKLKIIGLDGLSYYTLSMHLDRLPSWRKILRRGILTCLWATMKNYKRPWRFDSATLWTSLFTGERPKVHGIWGYKKGVDGEFLEKEAIRVPLVWEKDWKKPIRFKVWSVPVTIPPLTYNTRIEGKIMNEVDEWASQVREMVLEETDFDIFCSVFNGSDYFQHHYWHKPDAILAFYEMIGRRLAEVIFFDREDFLIISDHGFTDIDTALAHKWTWEVSKEKNKDTGHHAPWGMCVTNLKWVPHETTELVKAIGKWIEGNER